MQYLEGEREAVQNLLDIIKTDPRHHGIDIIVQGNEYHRMFPEWSMGFKELDNHLDKINFTQQPRRRFSLAELAEDPRTSYIFITSFRENNLSQRTWCDA